MTIARGGEVTFVWVFLRRAVLKADFDGVVFYLY
jgi:hypothetical protein